MNEQSDIIVVGSGMAGLTVASLLSRDAYRVTVLEQNWLPGGCMSSYPRKGYIFEAGATTLVGLDRHMPLDYLMEELEMELPAWELTPAMKVFLKNGQEITRYKNLDRWIAEAERVFGKKNQREFWSYCYKVSEFVWETSLKQRAFPPSSLGDLFFAARNFRPKQLGFAVLAFQSMEALLKKFGLDTNQAFVDFVNEQLLITAQNYLSEVNVLFGAAALCYTNYGNYYLEGGMIQLAKLLVEKIERQGGKVLLRSPVTDIRREGDGFAVTTKYRKNQNTFYGKKVVSAIPLNNTLKILQFPDGPSRLEKKLLDAEQVNSAFSMGLVIPKIPNLSCIHYQIHLKEPLPLIGSHSIFLSLSHPNDTIRCKPDEMVASISTHIPNPGGIELDDKTKIEEAIIRALSEHGFVNPEDIIYQHSSASRSWEKWTGRQWGFVGGYPQFMDVKPWQMVDARIRSKELYICGDSTYPGQGIPGACLSGIIAYEKMKLDEKSLIA